MIDIRQKAESLLTGVALLEYNPRKLSVPEFIEPFLLSFRDEVIEECAVYFRSLATPRDPDTTVNSGPTYSEWADKIRSLKSLSPEATRPQKR